MKLILHLVFIGFLTITTQIGGIVHIIAIFINSKTKLKNRWYRFLSFVFLYLLTTFVITPQIAPLFGREKITNNPYVQNHFFITTLCNRNYVKPKLNQSLQTIGKQLQHTYPNLQVIYLDANFPFINKFPLFPHLSHSDGKKIDLSFIYKNANNSLNKKPSTSGYGVFEKPTKLENNKTNYCKQKGYWQYDLTKYMTFGTFNNNLKFSAKATRYFIKLILQQPTTQKIFIEPHLKKRMKLKNPKIRFHGCQAVRHDDHIHLQIH